MSAADQMGKIQLTYNDGKHEERVRCMHIVSQTMLPGGMRARIVRAILEGDPVRIDDQDATGMGKHDPDALPGTIAAARRPPWPQGYTTEDIAAASFKLAGVEKPDKAPDRFRSGPRGSKAAPGCTCMLCVEDRRIEAAKEKGGP